MTYKLDITLPSLPKTVNGSHGSWQAAAAERKKWRYAVRMIAYYRRPPEPLTKAKLTCTRYSSSRPDRDNLAASFKSPVDGLVDARVLLDDSDDVLTECVYLWEKVSPKSGKIRLQIEEVA